MTKTRRKMRRDLFCSSRRASIIFLRVLRHHAQCTNVPRYLQYVVSLLYTRDVSRSPGGWKTIAKSFGTARLTSRLIRRGNFHDLMKFALLSLLSRYVHCFVDTYQVLALRIRPTVNEKWRTWQKTGEKHRQLAYNKPHSCEIHWASTAPTNAHKPCLGRGFQFRRANV